ncbi:T9SS-dependent M36 family metallopeptidase [Hymenobacter sp. HDW8]|uniref:T9SS-dependent M36 family metallopeptidase n=1 Tax=Hymenobacter sp. HDW8 TaxID=2714932 RepID=UPI00140AE4D2|nr:T9SS-dependent M36 family metallopeptidase [Hymenobacter sp. HDW8]QIL76006.1 T9SS type A sorting domain-containing protein [Hymenobacter sp. HDW8]
MNKLIPALARPLLVAALLSGGHASYSQNQLSAEQQLVPQAALQHLKKNKQALQLTDEDIADVKLSSESVSPKTGIKHVYLQQLYQGIEIHNAIANMSLNKDEKIVNLGNNFVKGIGGKLKPAKSKMTAVAAVNAAARHLNLTVSQSLSVLQKGSGKNEAVLLSAGGISLESIPAKLVYQPMEDGTLRLAWEVSIYELDAQNWWNVRVDAATGELLDKDNMVHQCEFDNDGPGGMPLSETTAYGQAAQSKSFASTASLTAANAYNVFPIPVESPNHGPRVLVSTSAADPKASPEGWHHTPAGKLTTTRGNNAYAYEDPNNNNSLNNYSPNGGAELNFDYPVDFTKEPVEYRDAAITNLFYWNNVTHDVWYQYGFDEASGNFQADNFGRGGAQGDYVRAEAQDSRNNPNPPAGVTTRNNANFSTPVDNGTSAPRMQMYLWAGRADANAFRITAPSSIANSYPAVPAAFGPRLNATPVTGKLVLASGVGGTSTNPNEACGALTNAAEIAGNIAVLYRGNCDFSLKVYNAQAAGAIAVVVINNQPGAPISMGAGAATPSPVVIPSIMTTDVAGGLIRERLAAGEEVRVSLKNEPGVEVDGDFDNGIIVHEYGHGISTRLTGGRLVNCLGSQAEQAGEGWSDWFALMMTMKPGDTRTKIRGIGTYASNQPTTGGGIRPAPYTTDFAVNNYTYGRTNNTALSQPHGIGFVWATTLWDMTWDLIDLYGYDPDLYNGKGGNNMAMQLVIDGLKMQPCAPGFVDARNAILAADVANYGGANQELIWRAFAKRGVGFGASQGAANSRLDQVESFDLPPVYACSAPTITATALGGTFVEEGQSTIYLGYGPQSIQLQASGDPTFVYTWAFVPGLSNTGIANPVFTPRTAGTYELTVTGVNAAGCTRTVTKRIAVVDVRCGFVFLRNNKVLVCHNGKPVCVSESAVAAHLNHGDSLGECQGSATAGFAAEEQVEAEEALTLTATPNPTNSQTYLDFTLTETGNYRLEVMNMQGTVVSVVAEGTGRAGENFSFKFTKGRLASGIYMVRLTSGKKNKFTRVVLQD